MNQANTKALNIIFAGTPEFAAASLGSLIASQHNIIAVYTQPDRPSGRGRKIKFSPVKQLANDAGLTVHQPDRLDSEACLNLESMLADVMVVSAYGLLLPQRVLAATRHGCINIHASLLPRWRGAAPIQRAILAGDEKTGITYMQMVEELDAGPMLSQSSCEICQDDTSSSLHDRLAQLSANEIVKILEDLVANKLTALEQDITQVTYAKKITKQEAEIDWQDDAVSIERKIRAFHNWPVAYSYLNDRRVRIWSAYVISKNAHDSACPGHITAANNTGIEVSCGAGTLAIQSLQVAGSKVVSAADFINAHEVLGKNFSTSISPDSKHPNTMACKVSL